METTGILHQFERVTGRFERAAVEAAIARREEITSHLLRIPDETVDRAVDIDDEGDYFITENLGAVLASVCGGELAGIFSLIENGGDG